jgi:hypothetical protein
VRIPYRSCGQCRTTGETLYEVAGRVEFCCASMCRYWTVLVGFGVKGHAQTTSREVHLYQEIPQAGGGPVCALAEIQFCPWCGEAVETCRVKGSHSYGLNCA